MAERLQPAPPAAQTEAAEGTSTQEESRAFLQQRLALMGKIGCICSGCFLLVAPTMTAVCASCLARQP